MASKVRRPRKDLERENRRLQADLAYLRRDNEDLRAAAMFWSRLYEGAIERARGRRASGAKQKDL